MTKKSAPTFNFEKALAELTTMVENMEGENLSLEDALSQFERGIKLTHDCQKALREAEQKVQLLIKNNGKEELVDYPSESE